MLKFELRHLKTTKEIVENLTFAKTYLIIISVAAMSGFVKNSTKS